MTYAPQVSARENHGLLTPEKKLEQINRAEAHPTLLARRLCPDRNIPIDGTAHQADAACFGTNPASSAPDLDCKAQELDNLDPTDASSFPSIGAVNPTLTIIANALRVVNVMKAQL